MEHREYDRERRLRKKEMNQILVHGLPGAPGRPAGPTGPEFKEK